MSRAVLIRPPGPLYSLPPLLATRSWAFPCAQQPEGGPRSQIGAGYGKHPWENRRAQKQFRRWWKGDYEKMAKRVLADFDLFAHTCPYFYNGAPVNNGYGCRYPECGEAEEDDAGQLCGCCHRYTCPICCPFGEEDLDDPELDLDGRGRQEFFDRDGGFADGGELVTVASGDEAGEEERAALLAYNRYLHRYDKEWLEKHPRQEPQSPAR